MLQLTNEQANAISAHGERDYPHECCGLLLGRFDNNGAKICVETFPISNAREEAAKRNRFLIRPEELLRGEQYAAAKKLEVIGFYHSHPDHPAKPSAYDLDHAWPVYSYIIVSVRRGGASEMLSWELQADRTRFNPEEIHQPSLAAGAGTQSLKGT